MIPVYIWIVVAWTAYAIDISPPGRLDRSGHIKGHDFAHFYVQGQIAKDRDAAALYDFNAHAARTDALVPEYRDRFLPVHPPQVAVFFAPLAVMPYGSALFAFITISVLMYAACCRALWRGSISLKPYGGTSVVLAAGFPALYALIASGQTSAFALGWITLGYFALRHNRPWLAGFALGALAYKPSLMLVMPIAWLFARDMKMLAGAAMSAVAQLFVAWAYFGQAAIAGYVANLRTVSDFESLLEARPELMHSLRSFFLLLLPRGSAAWIAYAVAAAAVTIVAVRVWRSHAPVELRYSVLVLATVLVDPHVYTYELVVLVPALMLLASWVLATGRASTPFWCLMYACYYAPALDQVTSITRVQWSVPALVVLTLMAARFAIRGFDRAGFVPSAAPLERNA